MAGTVVAMPMAGASQQPQFTTNPPGSVATNFQAPRPGAFAMPSIPDASQRGPRPFNRSHQFRPRFSMNKGGEDDSGMYDGKRMRKAIHRKTVDYNPSVIKFLENRVWQRDGRDEHRLQPDSLYSSDLIPPPALLDDPLNCVNTKFVRTSTNKFRCPIFCLTWTPEGRRLVTGASSGEFTLWNGLTFNFETILQAHETAVRAMRWSHSDSWMVTADHAGYIKYWQSNMNNVKMFQAHKEPIRGISFCPTDSKFASCSDDGTVRVWDFMRCQEERILRGHGADVRCVDWHPQKSLLASGSKDNQQPVKLWDPRTGNSLATLHAHKHTVMDLKWHTNGNWMLTASRDHLLKLFDTRNLKEELQTFKGHKREATAIGWHPVHEGLFASGSADGALMFWMVGCDHEVGGMEQAHEGMVWSLAWHPLGHILASGSNDHATKFWTRNRPGDEMRDKYNLNLLPSNMVDPETNDPVEAESVTPNLPGMGLEHGVAEHLQVKEEKKEGENELPSIPGLNWEEDSILLKAEERAANKKVPYARPVPKMFEQAWAGEIDIEQIKKEQQAKQQAKQAAQTSMNQPTLLLAQQMIGALTGALRQQLAGMPGGHMLLRPGGPLMLGNLRNPLMGLQAGRGPAPPGPLLLLQQAMGIPQPAQDGENSSGGAAGSSNGSGNTNKGSQSSQGTPGSNSQNTSADQGGAKPPTSTPSESSGQTGPHQGTSSGPAFQQPPVGPPPVRMGAPQAPMGGNMQQGQIRGPRPQGQMGGPPQGQMGGPPPGQMGGPPPGQMGGPPPGQMGGPPPGQMGGPPPGQMGGPPPGQMGGPPLQGNRGNVPQGHMDGPPPQGQRGGPSQGQMSGPLQGQIVGPQGQRSGPQQGQMGGPPQGQMVGPPQGQMSGPPQNQRSGPPQGHMGGPQQGPPQGQMHGPPHGGPMRRPLGAANQPQGPRPQGPAGGQRPRGPASEEMDTDERYNMQGPGRGPPSAELDEDFRAQRVYNGPAGPTGHAFSGEDQDLRQGGPPPPPPQSHQHHPKYNKPGPPQRHPRGQATAAGSGGGFDDYGDTDERMGDTGDYDYRKEGAGGGRGRGVGGRGRGGAPPPHKDNFQGRQPGGYGNYSGAGDATQGQGYDESEEYEKGGGGGGEWGDYGESYNEEYYDDYNNGYGGGGGGEGGGYQEHAPPPPHPGGRKRVWEEGPGQDRGGRGRARARGWGRGAQGESWGRGGSRGGYRGGPPPPAPRGGFRGRGAPWQRGGPGGDRGSGRGRGGYRGGY